MNAHTQQTLQADHDQIARFVSVLFRYADEGTFVSLRAFDQFDAKRPPFLTEAVAINGSLSPLIAAGTKAAQRCADHCRPIVFAPPIASFSNPDRARGVDLANGLALSVEIDEADPEAAQTVLERIVGPVTAAVESGSFWTNPETGECKPKLHLHWRLSEPTLDAEDHGRLRQARNLAALLVGADPTGKPIVHPLRWPGSWNCKATPRLAKIAILNETAEIHLDEALERLTEAVEAAGLQQADIPRGPSGPPQASVELVRSAMQAIPNPGTEVHYDDWIRFGYAAYRATGGSEEGFAIWDQWSRKSEKYDGGETQAAWLRIKNAIDGSNAHRTIGAGTIFYMAGKAGWQRPKPEPQNNSGATEESAADASTSWRAMLSRTEKGVVRANLSNVLIALRHAPEWCGVFAWNAFASRLMLSLPVPRSPNSKQRLPREVAEHDITNATFWMQRSGIQASSQTVHEAVRAIAAENSYHPVRDYLQGLQWDGILRIDMCLIDHLGAEDTDLHRAFGSRWMIGAVARVMRPGCQLDTALILEGRQGLMKSSALRTLGGDWFTDHMPDLSKKDAMEQLQGVWIIELAELSSLNRSETHRVKAFLSAPVDRFRPSYGRVAADFPRQCAFAGTINPGGNGYLRDETGARRFWTVACGVSWEPHDQIDIPSLKAVRDQLWAEAVHRYRAGEPWWLDRPQLETEQADAAEERQEDDARAPRIHDFIRTKSFVTMAEILGPDCLKIPIEHWTRGLRMEIGAVMIQLGWVRRRMRIKEGSDDREYRYYPNSTTLDAKKST